MKNIKKVLFITHLAIGDYTYLQSFFRNLKTKYPNLLIDIFIDERRKTNDSNKWNVLKNYSLYDWIKQESFINFAYCENYSPALYQRSIEQAYNKNYDLVVSLTTRDPYYYAKIAVQVAQKDTLVYAMDFTAFFFSIARRKLKQSINRLLEVKPKNIDSTYHVIDRYAFWFKQIADLDLTEKEKKPCIDIPEYWKKWAYNLKVKLNIDNNYCIFINSFSKNRKRTWPINYVIELIQKLNLIPNLKDAFFIINSVPEALEETQSILSKENIENVYLFSATDNFFQLPAILHEMDLVISVETAVMHLANAVQVPVIAMMRLKTPEWRPFDQDNSYIIFNKARRDVIADIHPDEVIEALDVFLPEKK